MKNNCGEIARSFMSVKKGKLKILRTMVSRTACSNGHEEEGRNMCRALIHYLLKNDAQNVRDFKTTTHSISVNCVCRTPYIFSDMPFYDTQAHTSLNGDE